MTQQMYDVGLEPKVILAQVSGDLSVRGWERRAISFETDGRVSELQQEGNALMIIDCDGDVALQVPTDTDIRVTSLSGDVSIEDVRRVELKDIGGDVELEDIGADVNLENISSTVELVNLAADLHVTNTPALRSYGGVGGDASLENVTHVELESIGADLSLEHTQSAVIGTVGADLDVEDIAETLSCGNVGGDCQVQGNTRTEITLGNVGGDMESSSAANVQIGSVGGDCSLRDVTGVIEVGNIGGDADIIGVGGDLEVGSIGGDAELQGLRGKFEVGSVGGDLELQAAFPTGSHARLNVGGDASIELLDNPNLSLRAAVGGDVSGQAISFSGGGNLINLVYGDGSAQLEVSVGGDLEINGGGNPRTSSTTGSWSDFGREMAELGREMGHLGQELSREFKEAFSQAGWPLGPNFGNDIARKAQERARKAQRKAEERARHAEERGRHANERANRMRVRINSREWQLDPERLERIKEQARRAATEGVSGALEAVERAVKISAYQRHPHRLRQPIPGQVFHPHRLLDQALHLHHRRFLMEERRQHLQYHRNPSQIRSLLMKLRFRTNNLSRVATPLKIRPQHPLQL